MAGSAGCFLGAWNPPLCTIHHHEKHPAPRFPHASTEAKEEESPFQERDWEWLGMDKKRTVSWWMVIVLELIKLRVQSTTAELASWLYLHAIH